jgi:hypothetical protein
LFFFCFVFSFSLFGWKRRNKFLLKCPLAVAVAVTLRWGKWKDGRRAARGRRVCVADCRLSAPRVRFLAGVSGLSSPRRDCHQCGCIERRRPWTKPTEREPNSQKANFLFLFLLLTFLLLLSSFGVAPVERRYTKRASVLLLLLCVSLSSSGSVCVCVCVAASVCVWVYFFARLSFCYSLLPLVAVFPHVLSGN